MLIYAPREAGDPGLQAKLPYLGRAVRVANGWVDRLGPGHMLG